MFIRGEGDRNRFIIRGNTLVGAEITIYISVFQRVSVFNNRIST